MSAFFAAADLARAVGCPRRVLDLEGGKAGELARRNGAEVVHVDVAARDPAAFDLVLMGDASRASLDRWVPRLSDGGHVLLAAGTPEAAARMALDAGLEPMWALRAPRGAVVARRRPAARPQSVTVGMISMNEEKAVGAVIDDIRKNAPGAEILLVDSSKDRTAEIAEARGARVVRQLPPRGYGPAMHRLLYEATTDVIVTMDCDGTYPAARIAELVELVRSGADLVNATRTRHRPLAMPLANFLANRTFAAAAQLLHGLPTTDVHSGMRAYRTSMLRGLTVDPNGAALPVELIVVPARLGYHVVELEIPYFERVGATTLNRFDSTKWTFKRLLRARAGARVRRERWITIST